MSRTGPASLGAPAAPLRSELRARKSIRGWRVVVMGLARAEITSHGLTISDGHQARDTFPIGACGSPRICHVFVYE